MAMDDSSLMRGGRIILAYDANRERNANEFKHTINGIRLRGGIIRGGDTIVVLGVLHRVLHPFGYHMQISPENFAGNKRMVEEEVSKRVDMHVNMLLQSAEDCKDEGVDIEVNIVAGTPIRKVVVQEATTSNATSWLILDRHLRRDLRYYLKHVPCKIAVVLDNLTVDVLRGYTATIEKDFIDHEVVSSMCKPVPLSSFQENDHNKQSVISFSSYSGCATSLESIDRPKNPWMSSLYNRVSSSDEYRATPKQEKSGRQPMGEKTNTVPSLMIQKNKRRSSRNKSSDGPIVCVSCDIKTEISYIKESMRLSYSEIQLATDDFSNENLLGEGGYGHVYKGELEDGQLIAAKVRKESSAQGFKEFNSEVQVLSFARHKNIVMLMGYCCKENINILVYEYICNKSLEYHLFDNTDHVLEWHQRRAIAIGTAKGLRFLHEECRSSPIIHRDLRPSNILLTHEYVPMLGDFGLAKWKTDDGPMQTRILGTFGYLAPEYAENGIISVRTDVYAFGITLIQLISGRKPLDSDTEDNQKSLRQWAEPLIERLALHRLTDPRLGDAYDTYELYHMARAAYLCVKTDPEMRPSMGEVVRLLEGENDHLKSLVEQFIPHFSR